MEQYDEDLLQNAFLLTLKVKFPELYEQAASSRFTVGGLKSIIDCLRVNC